ncbi:MAG: 5'-methylthioadenosine/adenosylhomocysteine nucleosidase [Leptotrichiaceae bacterium]|nr:5'-methylthioadenosine/adenosylhomocysteine nucleosidase [Leptotrichiaceae bacterium]
MIGIICATSEETQAVKSEMTDIQEEMSGGIICFKGKFCNKDIILVRSGIGKVNAAMTATILIYKYNTDTVIFSGVAGSLSKNIGIGDIVISDDLIQYDVNVVEFGYKSGQIPEMEQWIFKSDRDLLKKAEKINNSKFRIFFGRILTGDKFVSRKEIKEQLGNDFEGLCVDMESAAVAHVCYRMNVKFLAIRSISDSLTDESGMEYDRFVKLAADNSKEILKEILK